MDHLLPVQLVELQSIATDLAENRIAPLAPEVDAECRWPADSMQALAEAGLLGLQVPVELGGRGQGLLGFACSPKASRGPARRRRCATACIAWPLR